MRKDETTCESLIDKDKYVRVFIDIEAEEEKANIRKLNERIERLSQ